MAIVNIHRASGDALVCQGNNHDWPADFDDITINRNGGYNALQICQRCGKPRIIRFSAAKRRIGNIGYPNWEEVEFYRHHTRNFSKKDAQSEMLRRAMR